MSTVILTVHNEHVRSHTEECNYTFTLSDVLLYKTNHEVSQRASDSTTQARLFLFGCLRLFVFHSWIGFWAVGKPICGTAGKPATPTNAWRSTVKLSATSVNQEGWCSQTVCLQACNRLVIQLSCKKCPLLLVSSLPQHRYFTAYFAWKLISVLVYSQDCERSGISGV